MSFGFFCLRWCSKMSFKSKHSVLVHLKNVLNDRENYGLGITDFCLFRRFASQQTKGNKRQDFLYLLSMPIITTNNYKIERAFERAIINLFTTKVNIFCNNW